MENILLTTLFEQLQALHWAEWVAVSTALVYVVLAARNNIWCWPWGIISCSLWTWCSYFLYDLYLDALLQVFYVLMGMVGWIRWAGKTNQSPESITSMTLKEHLLLFIIGIPLSMLFGFYFDEFTPAAATYLDSFTTVFAILATFLLVNKKVENWLYWIVIDAAYIYLYYSRGGWLFSLLMVVYTGIAIQGYFKWRKERLTWR